MTQVPLDPLYAKPEHKTKVWVRNEGGTKKAISKFLKKHRQEAADWMEKLENYAETGFDPYIGAKRPIRHKIDKVYSIQHTNMLFRMYGCFGESQSEFFILTATDNKRGQDWDAQDRHHVEIARKLARTAQWLKNDSYKDCVR